MGKILCATRGGEASQRTQDLAIALAKERSDDLLFLYVVNTSFLDQLAAPFVVDIESRLERMGSFQLAIATERAAEQGVAAQSVVRRGRLQTELAEVAREMEVSVIVLGRPRNQTAVFDEAGLDAFARDLGAATGCEVQVV
jgi:nucleotide-binding universal stress UspA family protein